MNYIIKLGIVVLIFWGCHQKKEGWDKDFKIENSDEITKIFMKSKSGAYVILDKKDNLWYVNNDKIAEPSYIKLLIDETLSQLSVKGTVPINARDNVMRLMAGQNVKVEVYKGEKKDKVFYVGGTTQDMTGTYMLMENAEDPYVVHVVGFTGYLSSRFNTRAEDWYSRRFFQNKTQEMRSISLNYPKNPESNFKLTRKDSSFVLNAKGINQNQMVNFGAVRSYFKLYEKISFEGIEENKSKLFIDSLKQSEPYCQITVELEKNNPRILHLYHLPINDRSKSLYDNEGNLLAHDPARYYLTLNDDQHLYLVQNFVFKNVLLKPSDFLVKPNL